MKNKGFTLIELLVVMVVLLGVGTIIGTILFSSFRGANKTNTIIQVRQNGSYAISQMEKTIRNAKSFDSVINNCSPDGATPNSFVKIVSPDDTHVTFSCNGATISSNNVSLIDASAVSVVPDSCFFTCSQSSPGSSPVIGINFILKQAGSDSLFSDKKATIPFEASVTLRNVPR